MVCIPYLGILLYLVFGSTLAIKLTAAFRRRMFQPLVDAGGRVIRIKLYLTHYRSHRKIVTLDHRVGYIGGMNIGKQYANLVQKKNLWRDTQIRLTGACVAHLDAYFLTDLLCAVRRKDWEAMVAYMESLHLPPQRPSPHLCQFVVGGVDTDKEAVKMNCLSMIRSAKKKIRIQSPYFIPDASVLDALKTAAASGVEVEMMIPGIQASFFLDPVTTYYAGQLLEFGAKIYKYQGYIHAKTMTIDEELCCIGSVNMDMRSLMVDDEICGIFYANDLVQDYIRIFEEDIRRCDPYSYEDFLHRGRREKLAEGVFLPFAPLM